MKKETTKTTAKKHTQFYVFPGIKGERKIKIEASNIEEATEKYEEIAEKIRKMKKTL